MTAPGAAAFRRPARRGGFPAPAPLGWAAVELLRLDRLTVVRAGVAVLRDVTWRVRSGEHWVVLGSNGAGKSSLLRAVADRAQCDTVGWLADHPLTPGRSAVGAVLDGLDAAYRFDPDEAPEMRSVPGAADRERALALLCRLGCAAVTVRPVEVLSEGERRRVLLARALISDPELLLLDEPTAGLDLAGREALLYWQARVIADPGGPATVTVTHHLEDVPTSVTHALLLRAGAVVAAGPVATVLTGAAVSRCFGLPVAVEHRDGRWAARIAVAG